MELKTRGWWDDYFVSEVTNYDRYFTPQPTDVVVDCGAHIGTFTTRWAPYVQHVHAFEPHPKNFALLEENVQNLGLDNVTLYNFALSDYEGEANMDFNLPDNTGEANIFYDGPGGVSVPVRRLDDVLQGESVDFMKVDVEGAEAGILRGAEEILYTNKPKMVMEVHGYQNLTAVRELLAGPGYLYKADFYWFGLWMLYAK
jgi:FkbM family methyltransferase